MSASCPSSTPNVSLRVQETDSPEVFLVSGRGELHLAILIETMRREGYEFQVSKPEAIVRVDNGQKMEPFEFLVLDCGRREHRGAEREPGLPTGPDDGHAQRGQGRVYLEYKIATRGLIGFRQLFS